MHFIINDADIEALLKRQSTQVQCWRTMYVITALYKAFEVIYLMMS